MKLPTVSVHTEAGEIIGYQHGNRCEFRGIPYAEPPIGELRFAAPKRRARFDAPFLALDWGATPQRVPLFDDTFIPEPSVVGDDILNLNVFSPHAGKLREPLPVLFWIHGGGYLAGSAIGEWFHGESLNQHGIVVVSVSYRLGFDGFGWIDGEVNNRGLRDMIAALEWVNENIGAFGGDPQRITIAGQSAGGGAVLALAAAPEAKGLFSAAWSMSGVLIGIPIESARTFTREFAFGLRVDPTVEGFSKLTDEDLQRALADVIHLGDEGLARGTANAELPVGPVVGDDLLPESISSGLRSNTGMKPIVIGATADEFVAIGAPPMNVKQFRELVGTWQLTDIEIESYLAGLDESDYTPGRLATDMLFRSVVAVVPELLAGRGGETWAYEFRWRPVLLGLSGHCADIPFFFNVTDSDQACRKLGPSPKLLANTMHREFVNFIRTGLPGWECTDAAQGPVRIYDVPPSMKAGALAHLLPLGRQWARQEAIESQ